MMVAPRWDCISSHRTRAASKSPFTRTTSAPWPRVRSTFTMAVSSGMTTVARIPRSFAASATPCAWFPAEAASTPCFRWSSGMRSIRV